LVHASAFMRAAQADLPRGPFLGRREVAATCSVFVFLQSLH
jgi:hypothetical protein